VALLGAGWALLACGSTFWGRRPGNAVGPLLVAASAGWFLAEWDNPGAGSAVVFTIGLALYATCPPLVGWAMLAYPSGRLASWGERASVALALTGAVLVLGVLPAFFFDPASQGCAQCPNNLLLVTDEPEVAGDLSRAGVHLGLAWSLLLVAVAGWRLARSTTARRRVVAPVVIAGSAYLGLVAAGFATSLDRGFLGSGELERGLWLAQAGTLAVLALSVAWGWVRARRTRASLARLVIDLGHSATAGGLRDVLAGTLGDPRLLVGYRVGDGRLVDAHGRPVAPTPDRTTTPIVIDGREVAMIAHRTGLLDDPELAGEVAAAARLVLENERLHAQARAQVEDLRASRARIVEAGDDERRRLERDLHDGAQQGLVGLSLSLRLLRSRLPAETNGAVIARIDQADTALRAAMADLRSLARGLFPAVLADEGLAAAVEALAEEAHVPLRVGKLPEGRFPAAVESAVYAIVATSAHDADGPLAVRADRHDGVLSLDVETTGGLLQIGELEDRIGALEGRLAVERTSDGRVTIHAEIPCES
jgi:signal transduction histidine kinase